MADFKDHFSTQSSSYSKYRPEYPKELYRFLSDQCAERALAWDCATGNGQAARGLSEYFNYVHATDASEAQIKNAHGNDNVNFQIANASNSGLEDSSVDLITVAQALHWFDLDAFYKEVKRVLKPGGILAVWSYQNLEIDHEIDPLILHYYNNVVGDYWPKERSHIEDKYVLLDFPFTKLKVPCFTMTVTWTLDHLIGYLESWSATTLYIRENKENPLGEFRKNIKNFWSDGNIKRGAWSISLIVGQKGKSENAT